MYEPEKWRHSVFEMLKNGATFFSGLPPKDCRVTECQFRLLDDSYANFISVPRFQSAFDLAIDV